MKHLFIVIFFVLFSAEMYSQKNEISIGISPTYDFEDYFSGDDFSSTSTSSWNYKLSSTYIRKIGKKVGLGIAPSFQKCDFASGNRYLFLEIASYARFYMLRNNGIFMDWGFLNSFTLERNNLFLNKGYKLSIYSSIGYQYLINSKWSILVSVSSFFPKQINGEKLTTIWGNPRADIYQLAPSLSLGYRF